MFPFRCTYAAASSSYEPEIMVEHSAFSTSQAGIVHYSPSTHLALVLRLQGNHADRPVSRCAYRRTQAYPDGQGHHRTSGHHKACHVVNAFLEANPIEVLTNGCLIRPRFQLWASISIGSWRYSNTRPKRTECRWRHPQSELTWKL